MKALCRGCRTVGPTIPSVAESKATAEAHGWDYTRRGGFLCVDCQPDQAYKRMGRLLAVAAGFVAVAFAAIVLLVLNLN
jgi:hypothetical protein